MDLKQNTQYLLMKISESDEQSFAKLFDLYSHKVFLFASYFLKSKPLRDEVVSDVFLKIWENRLKIREIENFEAYLFTLARNQSFNYLDKVSRLPVFTTDFPAEIKSDYTSADESIIGKEIETILSRAIDDLPEKCRIIFLMSREDKLKQSEIAQILDISEHTVSSQIGIALRKLHSVIKNYLSSFL